MVRRKGLAAGVHPCNGVLKASGLIGPAEIVEQQRRGEQCCGRINDVLAGNIRCGAMDGLKIGIGVAVAPARCESETTNGAGSNIGQNITVQVRHDNDVKLRRAGDETPRKIIDNVLLIAQVGIFFGRCFDNFTE